MWDECFLLHTKIQCQTLWKGLFTQLIKLLFTHSHTSFHRCQLSALRPRSRIACWKTACLGFSVAAPNAIRQHSLSSRRQQYFGLFPGRALSPGGREEPQCPCPHHGSGQRSVRLHSGLLPAPWGLAGHLLSRFSL